ncbi:hypothetical protein NDU88_006337 [Pleurodeles waltl]|uniref:Uncharacterized protein n=1 Tax=Pleurodeles waltl TaxID=8319 RepID=A0AAV7TDZ3_PLEWA|nr:hypothetical protein NDU88_006337 [Pleurodeles waltl]
MGKTDKNQAILQFDQRKSQTSPGDRTVARVSGGADMPSGEEPELRQILAAMHQSLTHRQPADGPPPHPRGVTGRGGGRPRRCARAAVGHHRQPRAARSQAPRDGPGADRRAQPALPPRRGGEGWARRPAYLRGRTRGRGVGILLRAIGGGLTLELGGRRERKLPCDGPSRAPGKAPGRLTIERPSDRRSPGRNPGPQGAFEVSMINVSCNSY